MTAKTDFRPRLPPWIRVRVAGGGDGKKVAEILGSLSLHTVCESARCPNLGECWHNKTATFMILGDRCTRNCKFCAVRHSDAPEPPDPDEPRRVAEAAARMGLKYAVVTSVTRDDLPDGGAAHFAAVTRALREKGMEVEVLTPDFKGDEAAIRTVLDAAPTVFNHNVETVRRLSPLVRSGGANHERSLAALAKAAAISGGSIPLKSGLMVGMGETDEEVVETIRDLFAAGVRILTVGQYLPPGPENWPLQRYVEPEKFKEWEKFAIGMGFSLAACGPLVRSSYNAGELFKKGGPSEGPGKKN